MYDAVLRLRKGGVAVHRSGARHKVGDKILETDQLLALAASLAGKAPRSGPGKRGTQPPAPAQRHVAAASGRNEGLQMGLPLS